jgi:hypothetical protein
MLTWLKDWWAILTTAAASLIAYATLAASVADLEKAEATRVSDHDRIVRMEAKQDNMAEDITEMKADIKEIAKAVK